MSTATDTPQTILVVDDFDDTRLLLRTWLERRGNGVAGPNHHGHADAPARWAICDAPHSQSEST